MFIITRIKDIIDLVRNPPGEAVAAVEITEENIQIMMTFSEIPQKYLQIGDFLLELEKIVTVCPRKDFHKHYEFTQEPDPTSMTPVRTIKPL